MSEQERLYTAGEVARLASYIKSGPGRLRSSDVSTVMNRFGQPDSGSLIEPTLKAKTGRTRLPRRYLNSKQVVYIAVMDLMHLLGYSYQDALCAIETLEELHPDCTNAKCYKNLYVLVSTRVNKNTIIDVVNRHPSSFRDAYQPGMSTAFIDIGEAIRKAQKNIKAEATL